MKKQANSPRDQFVKKFKYISNEILTVLDIYFEVDDYQRVGGAIPKSHLVTIEKITRLARKSAFVISLQYLKVHIMVMCKLR